MKKVLIFILVSVFISTNLLSQYSVYAIRVNANNSKDSFLLKFGTDSLFNSSLTYVQRTKEYYDRFFEPVFPNQFRNYFLFADNIYRNIGAPLVGLNNVDNTTDDSKPISTAGQTALNLKQDVSTNNGGWTTLRTVGNVTTTGQALVDITGLNSGTLPNSTKYEIDILLDVGTSAVTTGTQYGIFGGGSGGAAVVSAILQGTTTVNAITQVSLSAPGAAVGTFLTTSGTSGTIRITGWITTRGSGTATISVQHLKVTSGTSTVRAGSVLRYRLAN